MESKGPSLKIFVNWLDTYTGYSLSRHLFYSSGAGVAFMPESRAEPETELTEEYLRKNMNFEIYGTLKSPDTNKSMVHVHKIISRFNEMELVECLMSCDVVIFDITDDPEQVDEARNALRVMEDNIRNDNGSRMFILLSTVLTWSRTPAKQEVRQQEEEEEIEMPAGVLPFTEDDYRRRKPHPNYRRHWLLEKDVIRIGRFKPNAFKTYVISAGLKYGKGEDILFFYFKTAWMNAQFLPCIGNGKNKIPVIYIIDVALLVQNLIERNGASPLYILAVDGTATHLLSVVKTLSDKLTTGLVRKISLENALLINALKTRHLDHLTCDLAMESTFITFLTFEGGLVPHMAEIIEEFKETHGLEPIRIFIHGPPGAGQKELTEEIAEHYKVHPLFSKTIVQEKIIQLKKLATSESNLLAELDLGEEEEEEETEIEVESTDDDESDGGDAISSQKTMYAHDYLKSLKESMERNNGELEDRLLLQILQEKLQSKPCQNQGFALYGYPETSEQAKDLFSKVTEFEDLPGSSVMLMPELVVYLDASDSFLKEKLILLPEVELVEQYGSEDALFHKLTEFRRLNTDEDSLLEYFDEQEIRTEIIDISTIESNKIIMDKVKRLLGVPRNFGLSAEEVEKQLKLKAEQLLKDQIEAKLRAEEEERLESVEKAELLREWQRKLAEVRVQEEQMLEAESLPMRNYLMQHVLPVLSHGLLECIKIRPQDPINFLAEYLFKFTPVEFPTPSTSKRLL